MDSVPGKFSQIREWHLTPVFLPGKFHGQRSLAGYSPWGLNELDTNEWLTTHTHIRLYIFFFFKFYFIFKLYNIVLVLPNIKMNLPQVYPCSPSWTLLPPPSPYPPSGSSQFTSPKHPVSCIEPGLATHFIQPIINFSTFIPLFAFPTVLFHLQLIFNVYKSALSTSI